MLPRLVSFNLESLLLLSGLSITFVLTAFLLVHSPPSLKYSLFLTFYTGYMDTALNNVPALDAQKKIWRSLTPQNRLGAVEDLNGLAVLLASDASAFMTGSNVIIDGGYTLY
jgi:hypothetical protein